MYATRGRLVLAVALLTVISACSDGEPEAGDAATTATPVPAEPRAEQSGPGAVHAPESSRAARSQATLDRMIGEDTPGCSAAVAIRGKVVWRGVRGIADRRTHAPITPNTVFELASVSKQFTALAILLLHDEGKLRLDGKLSTYLSDLPAWARTVTLAQLMHQTSGIPEFGELLYRRGLTFEDIVTQPKELAAIKAVKKLDSAPGTTWEYSNSNYLLLGEVVRSVSGRSLAAYLEARVFGPAGLAMVVDSIGKVPSKAVAYDQTASDFAPADFGWEMIGAAGVQSTPSDLARWGDNYRTGAVGGSTVLARQLNGAVPVNHGDPTASKAETADSPRYGAGIYLEPDGGLIHDGNWGGFRTWFQISQDRLTSLAVACNRSDFDASAVAKLIMTYWT